MQLLTPHDYRRMRWKNDLGWTTEIAQGVVPGAHDERVTADSDRAAGSAFDWRISIAEIEQDCAFSAFPEYARQLIVLDGAGIELTFDQAAPVTLHPTDRAVPFDGAWQTSCRLLDGPTRDFNVMARHGVISADVLRRPLVGSMWFHASPGTQWLIYMLAGHATVEGLTVTLETGCSLLLGPDSGHRLLDGGGDLVAVKLQLVHATTTSPLKLLP